MERNGTELKVCRSYALLTVVPNAKALSLGCGEGSLRRSSEGGSRKWVHSMDSPVVIPVQTETLVVASTTGTPRIPGPIATVYERNDRK